jgi:hypothetical protein
MDPGAVGVAVLAKCYEMESRNDEDEKKSHADVLELNLGNSE